MPNSVYVLAVFLVTVLLLVGILWLMSLLANEEVKEIPRVPMSMCRDGRHGLYPTSAAITSKAAALGMPDIEINICPFCFDEKMKEAEAVLQR